ncbi:MAG: hypothetical protein OQK97_04570 [Deltaproteobacteria bacterium]|nr:hypothetical protein [Deltaproteobacteria bacterium]
MSAIDAYQATRNLIENSFSHLTWYEDVCTQSGFKGISQIWKEEPAWYFWLEQVKGAFLLRLHAEEPLADNQFVSLSLHYFPAAGEAAYKGLSAGEKWLLSDEKSFDRETNTPQFETYEQFVDLFVVAEIGLVIDADNQLLTLLYSSEENPTHPAGEFLDLLVNTLNFQSKQHHQRAFELQDDKVTTLFLDHSPAVFDEFIKEFQLDKNQLKQMDAVEKLEKWKRAAHIDAVCSMNGACSCEH